MIILLKVIASKLNESVCLKGIEQYIKNKNKYND